MERRLSFEELIGDNFLIGTDSENFIQASDYQPLVDEGMSKIANGEIALQYIEGIDHEDGMRLVLKVDDRLLEVEVEKNSDYFDFSFFEKINSFIQEHNLSSRRYYCVEPDGFENQDQAFWVAFIDESLYSKLDYFGYSAHDWDVEKWQGHQVSAFKRTDNVMFV